MKSEEKRQKAKTENKKTRDILWLCSYAYLNLSLSTKTKNVRNCSLVDG